MKMDPNFNPAQGPQSQQTKLVTLVELQVTAKKLLDKDVLSKSDPVCVLYSKDLISNQYIELGRTEQIKNNLNPCWTKKFTVDYRFEERQVLKFSIYDYDSSSERLSDHDFLGSLECSLGEIVAAPNKQFERHLELPKGTPQSKTSSIVIVAEELGQNKEVLHMKANGRKLDKKDLFGKSDPYFVISKQLDDGISWSKVFTSEIIKNNLNPDWRPFSVRVASLTGGKPERKLKVNVFDWDNDGSSDLIGEFDITYAELLADAKERALAFPLINQKKKDKKKGYTNSGLFNIDWLRIEEEKSFVDHIQSGVQLHFTVAIDFTASNGDPNSPQSLHYRNPSMDNQYSMAIKAVGEIIQDYDSDKLFPALGFGARIPPNQAVYHEFFLNMNPQNPFCQGVQGILDAYHHSLNTVQLYGPTYFAPVINHVAKFASAHQDGRNYFILLIITDGVICDMDATKEAVINASGLPMSIIIVGVGNEDFSAMEFLDSDNKLLTYNGRSATRDIVQFVEMRKFYRSGHVAQNSYGTYQQPQYNPAPYPPQAMYPPSQPYPPQPAAYQASPYPAQPSPYNAQTSPYNAQPYPAQPNSYPPSQQQAQYDPRASVVRRETVVSKASLARCVLAELPDQLVLWMKKFNMSQFRKFMTNVQYGENMQSRIQLAKSVLAEVPDQVCYYMKSRALSGV